MNDNALDKYLRRRDALLDDATICEGNRRLFRRFFEYEEYKLKRQNRLTILDASCIRTLDTYIFRFRNVNTWFLNKPLTTITKADIKRVYDDLEDGKIISARGTRFTNRHEYYSKVFKSKLFALAGKQKQAKSVIQFTTKMEAPVRYATEEGVRRLAGLIRHQRYQLLVWLAFDIGENINSLRQLVGSDFARQVNPNTGDPEYRVNLRREILKRSRTPRSEITNYPETVKLLDDILTNLSPSEKLFKMSYHAAQEVLERTANAGGVHCEPTGDCVTWKDLRSGMACDLLRKGWTRDEINKRLGHKPSSTEIDRYINFLAIDGHRPKAKLHQFEVSKLKDELEQTRSRERSTAQKLSSLQDEVEVLRSQCLQIAEVLQLNPSLSSIEMVLAIRARTSSELASSPALPQLNMRETNQNIG